MLPRSFYFIRHGQTDWNLEKRFLGQTDMPLNATGIKQAEDAGPRLEAVGLQAVVTSDLIRARQTAEAIAATLELPVYVNAAIRERNLGMFEGHTEEELKAMEAKGLLPVSAPVEGNGFPCPPEGETFDGFVGRVIEGFRQSLDDYEDKQLLFVGHMGVFMALTHVLLGKVQGSKNTVPYYFEKTGNGWTLHDLSEEK